MFRSKNKKNLLTFAKNTLNHQEEMCEIERRMVWRCCWWKMKKHAGGRDSRCARTPLTAFFRVFLG